MLQTAWVEIPVLDLDRALKFYQTVFELAPTEVYDEGVRRTTVLTNSGAEGQPGISLNQTAHFTPSAHGPLLYLETGDNIAAYLARVPAAGGKVLGEKTSMGAAGFYAMIEDSEGNAFALYSAT